MLDRNLSGFAMWYCLSATYFLVTTT